MRNCAEQNFRADCFIYKLTSAALGMNSSESFPVITELSFRGGYFLCNSVRIHLIYFRWMLGCHDCCDRRKFVAST